MKSQIAEAEIAQNASKFGEAIINEYLLLTKEDLMLIDREKPKWRKIRIAIIIIYFLIWAGLLTAACLFIYLNTHCPARPSQEFWESSVGYWTNPFSFKDSNGDFIGDLRGLADSIDYFTSSVSAGFVILTPMVPIYRLALPQYNNISFKSIHSALGDMNDFDEFVRTFKKKGLSIVVSLNFNSVPADHELAKAPNLEPSTQQSFCRTGKSCAVLVNNIDYYSSYGSGSDIVDLNLTSPAVVAEIKDSIRFWLMKGADGVLLEDAAFYVEEGVCNQTAWEESFPSCKLYTRSTIAVIQELRRIVDEISRKTSRQRVLIADPGNTGYGPEYAESLLGTNENPGAHIVISRYFVSTRGTDPATAPTLEAYKSSVNASIRSQLALSVATPVDKPYLSLISTALIFLLPGTPIIYAGSELGWAPSGDIPLQNVLPIGNHRSLGNYYGFLPMPWDIRGAGFSGNKSITASFQEYLRTLHVNETVEAAMAAGRGESIFTLTKSLIDLRGRTPSLQWGDLDAELPIPHLYGVQTFKRSAAGFDSILVVLVKNVTISVIDFSSVCSTLAPVVVYPPNDAFKLNKELSSLLVFIRATTSEAVYVFKCHPK